MDLVEIRGFEAGFEKSEKSSKKSWTEFCAPE
jgi:hypothetical protein